MNPAARRGRRHGTTRSPLWRLVLGYGGRLRQSRRAPRHVGLERLEVLRRGPDPEPLRQLEVAARFLRAAEPLAERPQAQRAADTAGVVRQRLLECLLGSAATAGHERADAPGFHVDGPVAPGVVTELVLGRVHELLQELQARVALTLLAQVAALHLPQPLLLALVVLLALLKLAEGVHLAAGLLGVALLQAQKRRVIGPAGLV